MKISGVVQGVGFRFFTRRLANKMGIKGYVRNMPDGTVEIEAEGSDDQIESFLKELYKGPPSSKVSEIDTEELSGRGRYDGFEVRF
jgi:acylphosphatase